MIKNTVINNKITKKQSYTNKHKQIKYRTYKNTITNNKTRSI